MARHQDLVDQLIKRGKRKLAERLRKAHRRGRFQQEALRLAREGEKWLSDAEAQRPRHRKAQ